MIIVAGCWSELRSKNGSDIVEPMPRPNMSDILSLSIAERIELVQDIWDSIVEIPGELTLSEDQKRELDSRAAKLRQNPNAGSLWENIKANLPR